jgi:hypothetical protein
MNPIFMRLRRFAAFLCLAAIFLLVICSDRPAVAGNYSCGDPNTGHCYGVAYWEEQTQYYGAYTDLLQVAMNCPSGCGGFIDNEIWLVDTQTAACVSNPEGQCWVEAGFIAQDGGGNPYYFWADSRPMNSNTFNLHILNQADSADFDHFMIIKDARGAQGVFQVWIYNDSHSLLFNGTSTSNAMSGNKIIIGSELAGTNGASAPPGQFQRNIWAVKPLGPEFVFWYNRQTDEGNVLDTSPHNVSWWINPSLPPPPEGGLFATTCCN